MTVMFDKKIQCPENPKHIRCLGKKSCDVRFRFRIPNFTNVYDQTSNYHVSKADESNDTRGHGKAIHCEGWAAKPSEQNGRALF